MIFALDILRTLGSKLLIINVVYLYGALLITYVWHTEQPVRHVKDCWLQMVTAATSVTSAIKNSSRWRRVSPEIASLRQLTHTDGYNFVKIFDATEGRNCSRAYSRQYQSHQFAVPGFPLRFEVAPGIRASSLV
jgi:hypothetical protein